MPTVTQMVTWIQLQAPGWNREGDKGIIPLMNEVYNILRRVPSEQNVAVSAGELPSLSTQAGTPSYNLPDNIWRVEKIGFAMPYNNEYNLRYLDQYSTGLNRQRPDEYFYFAGRKYFEFKHVRCFDKSINGPARIEFLVDPETSSNLFLYKGYNEPTPQLTSEDSLIDIPQQCSHYLLEGTLKLIEAFQNGNYVDAYQYINKELKPEVANELNLGDQGMSGHVERREL